MGRYGIRDRRYPHENLRRANPYPDRRDAGGYGVGRVRRGGSEVQIRAQMVPLVVDGIAGKDQTLDRLLTQKRLHGVVAASRG